MDKDKHLKFIDDLQDLLQKHYETENEEQCRYGAVALFLEGINLLYINSSQDENFHERAYDLFEKLLYKYLYENERRKNDE